MIFSFLRVFLHNVSFEFNREGELSKARAEHENFAHIRSVAYIGKDLYFKLLDEAITDGENDKEGKVLFVSGQSGSGKSSLIANWWLMQTSMFT